ncbi:hypothetical protein MTO96_050473 [Rhipicephalus appendiculatus]
MHNTLEEIAEAQERAQVIRLSGTKAGRRLLMAMGIPSAMVDDNYQRLLKVNGQWVKWNLYTAVYKEDCKNTGGLKLKAKLDGLVETGDWDLEDAVQDSQTSSEVVDAVLYYITGFLSRKDENNAAV